MVVVAVWIVMEVIFAAVGVSFGGCGGTIGGGSYIWGGGGGGGIGALVFVLSDHQKLDADCRDVCDDIVFDCRNDG